MDSCNCQEVREAEDAGDSGGFGEVQAQDSSSGFRVQSSEFGEISKAEGI